MPLTKSYTKRGDDIEKTSYPHAYHFTSHTEEIESIETFFEATKRHASLSHCLLKGTISAPLEATSRAGSTLGTDPTEWICLDIDGLPSTVADGTKAVEALLAELGLDKVSYVLQWSASYKIPMSNTALRCHVFMLIDKPIAAIQLREWLVSLNMNNATLREATTLASNHTTLKWCLDVTACQNDKLLYIASPVLRGVTNPFASKPRITLVKKSKAKLSLPNKYNSPEQNREAQKRRIEELRTREGLPARKEPKYKVFEGTADEVLTNPDRAVLTGIKRERGFVYLNLNGGDSWGYFHPEDNADVIYNFKGEDPCSTKALLPSYWSEASGHAKRAKKEAAREANTGAAPAKPKPDDVGTATTPLTLLAFQDQTGSYYRGMYVAEMDELKIHKVKSEKQVRDFGIEKGIFIGDNVPIWELTFDPRSEVRVDVQNRVINQFQMSAYMRAPKKQVKRCPPTIFKLIHHVLGGDVEITEHFMNWLAYIVQVRERTQTAWVMYGTEGTGKGLLFHKVLSPMLNPSNCTMNQVDELAKGYNGFIRNKLLVAFDETHIPNSKNPEEMLARLRNMITESVVSIRDLYAPATTYDNYTSYLFFSNKPDVILLNTNDRRYNIGKYQHDKLKITPEEIEALTTELQAFTDYMRGWPVNEQAAQTVLDTADRQALIATTISSADDVANALKEGTANMAFFINLLPNNDLYKTNALTMSKVEDYKSVIFTLIRRTRERMSKANRSETDAMCVASRDEVRTIFDYAVGKMSDSPHKFTQYMRHRHLTPQSVWIDGRSMSGITIDKWNDIKHFDKYIAQLGITEKT